MKFGKRGFPLPSTESGQTEWAAGIFFLVFLGIMLCAHLQTDVYVASSQYLEDALALSNLASAVVDIEEYGRTHTLSISDPKEAYERYRRAVKENLNLDDQWECRSQGLITGPVTILNYTVYNVKGDRVEITSFGRSRDVSRREEALGSAVSPNGILIESTGVYSEISYTIKGFLGVTVEARKGKLVDVVADSEN